MPVPKPGDVRKSSTDEYEIVKELNRGAFAMAFQARSRKTGASIFLKRYIDPKPSLEWYASFVDHQETLKERVAGTESVQQYCYRFVEFFEAENHFFQAFEFVEGGMPLTEVIGAPAHEVPWEQRVRFARVMMAGIAALHGNRIVHTDLKPDNLLLVPNPHAPGQYFLRIIDMDWAIFTDRAAPWHGRIGYIGTPGYQSPEHLTPGTVPVETSDVFTCAIMLSELLGHGHPFTGDYQAAALGGRFTPFRARAPIAKVPDMAALESLVAHCLDPDPARRPTAAAVKDALLGKAIAEPFRRPPAAATPPPPAPAAPAAPPRSTRSAPAADPAPAPASRVTLRLGDRDVLTAGIDTRVGRSHLKAFGDDYRFFDDQQFRLYMDGDAWMVAHNPEAKNDTLVDGHPLDGAVPLKDGMRIAVGKAARGIEKMAMTVSLT